jgi:hypothetical protein
VGNYFDNNFIGRLLCCFISGSYPTGGKLSYGYFETGIWFVVDIFWMANSLLYKAGGKVILGRYWPGVVLIHSCGIGRINVREVGKEPNFKTVRIPLDGLEKKGIGKTGKK